MLLIGMISFTAMAHTPLTDQNKKTEFVQHYDVTTNDVIVLEVSSVTTDVVATQFKGKEAQALEKVSESNNHLSVVKDVGWCNSWQPINKIFYKQKLLANYNPDVDLYIKNYSRTRDNS
ncbi:hypothetical protein [Flavobacterium sp.]